MRKTLRPRARHSQLEGGVDRVQTDDGVSVVARRGGAEELIGIGLRLLVEARLDPYLVDLLRGVPPRERADGVAAREDRVEVLKERLPGEPFEHSLAHLVGGLHIQLDPRNRPDRA